MTILSMLTILVFPTTFTPQKNKKDKSKEDSKWEVANPRKDQL